MLLALLLTATFARPLERVSTMDPANAQSAYDSHAIQLVYETPLEIDYAARPYRLKAGFCELPEVSADGLTYRFKIARKATGAVAGGPQRPLRAQDMVRSLKRLSDPDIVSPNAWMMKDVAAIEAKGDNLVEIRLTRRTRYFPWLMAMSPCAIRGENGEGTGPYRLDHWRKNHEMVFHRRYPLPGSFDKIRYFVIDDPSTQWLMFLRGEVDMLADIPRDNWESVVDANGQLRAEFANRGMRLHPMPTLEVMYIGVNMRDKVLGPNRKLRQALNAAFDFPAWKRFLNGKALLCDGPVPHGVADRLETPFAYVYNLDKAKRLLVEAGYPDGIDPKTGRRLTLTMAIGRASQESREAGELTASFYAKVGIRLELDFMTWDAFLKAVNEGRVQLYRMGWVGDYPDAQNFLQLFYGPNASPGVNHSNYVSADFDAAYEHEDYVKCQEIVREDCPWIFTHFNLSCAITGPGVDNYLPSCFPYGNEAHYRVRNAK